MVGAYETVIAGAVCDPSSGMVLPKIVCTDGDHQPGAREQDRRPLRAFRVMLFPPSALGASRFLLRTREAVDDDGRPAVVGSMPGC